MVQKKSIFERLRSNEKDLYSLDLNKDLIGLNIATLAIALRHNNVVRRVTVYEDFLASLADFSALVLIETICSLPKLDSLSIFFPEDCHPRSLTLLELLKKAQGLRCLQIHRLHKLCRDDVSTLSDVISNLPCLKRFSLFRLGVENYIAVDHVTKALSSLPALEEIIIRMEHRQEVNLSAASVAALCKSSALKELTLWNLVLDDSQMLAFTEALKSNTILSRLELWDSTDLSGDSGICLARMLEVNQGLRTLAIRHDRLDDNGCAWMAKGLQNNATLRHLELRNRQLRASCEGITAIADMLRINSAIESLSILHHGLNNECCMNIAKAVEQNKTLKTLELRSFSFKSQHNTTDPEEIGCEDFKAVAQMLRINSTLQRLTLSRDGLDDEGCIAIADALENNSSLKELDLRHFSKGVNDRITSQGYKALVRMLHKNYVLETLLTDAKGDLKNYMERILKLNQIVLRNSHFDTDSWIEGLVSQTDNLDGLLYLITANPSLCDIDYGIPPGPVVDVDLQKTADFSLKTINCFQDIDPIITATAELVMALGIESI